jgi:hypothetical protein
MRASGVLDAIIFLPGAVPGVSRRAWARESAAGFVMLATSALLALVPVTACVARALVPYAHWREEFAERRVRQLPKLSTFALYFSCDERRQLGPVTSGNREFGLALAREGLAQLDP